MGNSDPFLVRRTEGGNDKEKKKDKLYAACIVQQQGMSIGSDIRNPMNTIIAGGMGHMYLAMACLEDPGDRQGDETDRTDRVDEARDAAYGDAGDAKDTRGTFPETVEIHGIRYHIADIGLRILEPKELYGCQGFPEDYIIDRDSSGKAYPRGEQVKQCGNAVCPPVPAALIRANLPELCAGAGKKKLCGAA